MEPATYPDPFAQALGHAAQRSAQLASIVMTAGQMFAWYRAQREQEQAATDEQAARAARDQQRAAAQQGHLGWAPALDPKWLGQADLLQTARAWGAATPFADTDPAAASALRTCEERLRRLHPYAMAYYDRLREDGSGPIDAMRETVPLFTREPNVRTGDPAAPQAALEDSHAASGADTGYPEDARPQLPSAGSDRPMVRPDEPTERRARQIVQQLQAQARASGRAELAPDELATVLEAVTNLPEPVIAEVTGITGGVVVEQTAAQVAAESFPYTAAQAVAAAGRSGTPEVSRATRSRVVHQTKRPGRSI